MSVEERGVNNMDEQQVLLDVILPDLQDNESATLFNDVSRVLYRTYEKPMGAGLCAVVTYVIKKLEEENKIERKVM